MGAKVGGLGSHPTSYVSTHPIFYSAKGSAASHFQKKTILKKITKQLLVTMCGLVPMLLLWMGYMLVMEQ